MGSSCDITFYTIPSFPMNSGLWKGILEELGKIGCSADSGETKTKMYWSDANGDWFEYEDINYAINTLCKDGRGVIQLWIGRVNLMLSIRPNPVKYVSISADRTYFCREKGDEIWCSSTEYYLWNSLTGKEFSLKFLEIGKKIYENINPFYGFGDIEEIIGSEFYSSYEEVKSEYIKAIYWTNFFGPKLVQKLGREKLLSAPSYITEELSDGGIMLIRSPNPFTIDEPYIKAEEIEKHLGIR